MLSSAFRILRAGNLVDQSMSAELAGEVTSSAGPVRLADLQRILRSIQPSGIIFFPIHGGIFYFDIVSF